MCVCLFIYLFVCLSVCSRKVYLLSIARAILAHHTRAERVSVVSVVILHTYIINIRSGMLLFHFHRFISALGWQCVCVCVGVSHGFESEDC